MATSICSIWQRNAQVIMRSDSRQPPNVTVDRSPAQATTRQAAGRWVLVAAILGSTITFIDGTVVNVVLPVLQHELGASVTGVQWIVESYALMLAALILTGGALGDRLGRKRVFSAGVLLFACASIWCGLAPDIKQLILARGVQGVGAAFLVPGSLALITASYSKEKRGRAIGTWSGFTSIAAGLGPLIGGWLVEKFSWRWIFFMNIPLTLAVLLITWRRVPESRDQRLNGRIDLPGAMLATVGLGGVVFGLIESNTRGFTAPLVLVSLLIGGLGLLGFVFAEAYEQAPMMPLRLFRSPTFAGTNLLTLFLYAALGGLLFFLPFNLIQVQGYSPPVAGAALLPFVLTMFFLSRWAGGLVERYGAKLPLVIGPLIAAAGFALFALPGARTTSYWTSFFPAVMVLSVGMATSVAPLTTTVMSAVDERQAGVASGVNNAVSRIAALLAVAAFGVVMLSTFNHALSERLQAAAVPPSLQAQLAEQRADFTNLKIPEAVSSDLQATIQQAIQASFISGFRRVAYLAAGLALTSSLVSWLLIAGKSSRESAR